MLNITLKALRFEACYGLYAYEQETPNRFELDITIQVPAARPDDGPLLDYQVLHDAAQETFQYLPQPQTLERLLSALFDRLRVHLPPGAHVALALRKLNPALGAALDYAEVKFEDRV